MPDVEGLVDYDEWMRLLMRLSLVKAIQVLILVQVWLLLELFHLLQELHTLPKSSNSTHSAVISWPMRKGRCAVVPPNKWGGKVISYRAKVVVATLY